MKRKDIYKEIEGELGLVPSLFDPIPDDTLELEWRLFKKVQMDEGVIPNKYRELIGIGISGVTRCRYCTMFHTEMAKVFGATDAEIEAAVHYSKSSAGWSAYLNGMQMDYDKLKAEVKKVGENLMKKGVGKKAA